MNARQKMKQCSMSKSENMRFNIETRKWKPKARKRKILLYAWK